MHPNQYVFSLTILHCFALFLKLFLHNVYIIGLSLNRLLPILYHVWQYKAWRWPNITSFVSNFLQTQNDTRLSLKYEVNWIQLSKRFFGLLKFIYYIYVFMKRMEVSIFRVKNDYEQLWIILTFICLRSQPSE